MKRILQLKLKYLAKMVLSRYQPRIIGITGSIGKTSAKEGVYAVLSKKFRVRRSLKNYNNEIGLPLTILGMDSPGRSLIGWIRLFFRALRIAITKQADYPEILILEMGIDRPGDMAYLTGIAKPDIGIVTLIAPVHIEYFDTIEKIRDEKGVLIEALPDNGWAILNFDEERTRKLSKRTSAKVLTYGLDEGAKVRARETQIIFDPAASTQGSQGTSFKLGYDGSYVPVFLPNAIGRNAVYAALAGAAAGVASGMNLVEISEALRAFRSPKGRMNIIKGVKNTIIIDDTYNASPQSAIAALDTVAEISLLPGKKKYAIFGDMLELGNFSVKGHKQTGAKALEAGVDYLIAVGERARDIARGAIEAGMDKDHIFHFPEAVSAGKFVQERIAAGDLILVKGSQGMRMEKIVKEIMADPLRAEELLVRMGPDWVNRI